MENNSPTNTPNNGNLLDRFQWLIADLPELFNLAKEGSDWVAITFTQPDEGESKPGFNARRKKEALEFMLAGFDLANKHAKLSPQQAVLTPVAKMAFTEFCSGLLEMIYQQEKSK